jgi:hypothetical protein
MPVPGELDEEESVDLSIPGACFLRLLTITAPSVLPGDSYLTTTGLDFSSGFACVGNCENFLFVWCAHAVVYSHIDTF